MEPDSAPRLMHTVPDAAEQLGGMSRTAIYGLIASGEIATVKVGRRTYITHDELQRYVGTLNRRGDRTSA